MSEDEVVAMVVSVVVALITWGRWYARLTMVPSWHPQLPGRRSLALVPALCAGAMLLVLRTIASADVVNDARYILMYLLMGMAWIGIVVRIGAGLGISHRTDAVERSNPAAITAISGLLIGATACYAGGNVGNGPGWWVVVLCAILANATLLAGWLLLELMTHVGESVTVERSRASGMRLAGYLIGTGLVCGRAVAGDWVSLDVTIRDFAMVAWPAIGLLGLAMSLEFVYRPAPGKVEQPILHAGWLPMLTCIGFGVYDVLLYGMPASGGAE